MEETHPLYAETLTHYLAIGAIIGLVVLGIFVLRMIYLVVTNKPCPIAPFVHRYILLLGFLMTFFGTGMSLFYSDVLKYAPCDLCWYQRIFLYPQVFMFAYAWYKKDYSVLAYSALLSIVGGIIGLYHHMLQIGFDLMKPCSTAPFAVDCAAPTFVEFGFVTFPLMSSLLFGFLLAMIFVVWKFKK